MARITGYLVALAVLGAPTVTLAQGPAPAAPDRPRVELGVGAGALADMGTYQTTDFVVDTRVGVRLSRSWSLEGLVEFMPSSGADLRGYYRGYYRAQALWRIGGSSLQPFLAFGGAGEFRRYSWPEYRWTDYDTGEARVTPAGSHSDIDPPWYPTAAIGFQKVIASHLAVRAELTTAFGHDDYGITVAFLPAVSVSVPIGRYRTAAR